MNLGSVPDFFCHKLTLPYMPLPDHELAESMWFNNRKEVGLFLL